MDRTGDRDSPRGLLFRKRQQLIKIVIKNSDKTVKSFSLLTVAMIVLDINLNEGFYQQRLGEMKHGSLMYSVKRGI